MPILTLVVPQLVRCGARPLFPWGLLGLPRGVGPLSLDPTCLPSTCCCSDGLKWKMEGRSHARHCLLNRSLLPLLVNPSAEGEEVRASATAAQVPCSCAHQSEATKRRSARSPRLQNLNYAIEYAASLGIVKPNDHIVCVQRAQNDICIKVRARRPGLPCNESRPVACVQRASSPVQPD